MKIRRERGGTGFHEAENFSIHFLQCPDVTMRS